MVPSVKDLLVLTGVPLRIALECIDRGGQGFCFVVDSGNLLVGILTDGDIRRALLAGATLASQVDQVMQKAFTALPADTPQENIQKALSLRIRYIPLLDSEGRLVDYASIGRMHRIPIMEPWLAGNELSYVTECVTTNWISSQGRFVRKFEEMFAEYIGVPNAVAVSNGTSALHLALSALGVGKGDEVVVPDFTFAASINAILHCGAVPVLVDVDSATWTLDPHAVRRALTPRTKAIMPVHLYGHPCAMDELMHIAHERGALVVEDCAESLGSTLGGRQTGSFGDAAAFSFFGNKTVTTGEGGMVLFRSRSAFEMAQKLRDHGMSRTRRYWHDVVGYNYRMTNLQAAIGVAQMERVDVLVAKKKELGTLYSSLLAGVPGIVMPPCAAGVGNTYWLYTVVIDSLGLARDELMSKLLMNGIETRPAFFPLHEMPLYKTYADSGRFPVTEYLATRGLSLPSSLTLEPETIRFIAQAVRTALSVGQALTSNTDV